MLSTSGRLIAGLVTATLGLALTGPPARAAQPLATVVPASAQALVLKARPRATISATLVTADGGRVQVTAFSNAKRVRISYRLRGKSRSVTVRLRGGAATRLLPAGSTKIRVQAKSTSILRASAKLQVFESPGQQPAPNQTSTVPAPGGTPSTPPPAAGSQTAGGSASLPPAAADTTPPGAPGALRVTSVAHNVVSLGWAKPSDSDLERIVVRRVQGGTPPATTAQGAAVAVSGGGTAATDPGLSANTRYSYSVFASDRAGNVSTPATLTVTTLPTPVGEGANNLPAGYSLEPGVTMRSPDGRYLVRNQNDGNLVQLVADSNRAVWSTNTAGNGPSRLVMQTDGNLVLYSLATNRPTWSAGTAGVASPRFDVQNDSNLVVYGSSGARWASSTVNDRLVGGEWLHPGQSIRSRSGRYQLIQQGDGNLVVYDNGSAIWSTTKLGPDRVTVMQGDGNLVVYAPGSNPVWSSGTAGNNGAVTVMQDDGNLVIYAPGGRAVWASRSQYPYGKIGASPAFAGVAWDVDSAMSWALAQAGTTNYEPYWCLRATWDAYHHGRTFGGRGYGTALEAWNGNTTKHPGDRRPPYGAIVYYTSNQSAGHAALSLGDGRVLSNNVGGRYGITSIDSFSGYLGWGQFDG